MATVLESFGVAGAALASHRSGGGPGLVLVHGTASTALHQQDLADLLAARFTVHAIDRPGRGESDPVTRAPTLDDEVEALLDVVATTGATRVAGVSSGAIVCLEAARRDPLIAQVVAFEPPLLADASAAHAIAERFDDELQSGRMSAALVTAMLGAEMGPALLRKLPRVVLERLVSRMATRPQGRYPSMAALAPSIGWDLHLVAEAAGSADRWAAVRQPVLLLGGSQSPRYLRQALAACEAVLPTARRIELPGLGHDAPWNRDLRGHPEMVAEAMLPFLEEA